MLATLPILCETDALIAFALPGGEAPAPPKALAPVYRLDPGASGVLLCAKTKRSLDLLSGQFQAKSAAREFLALAAILPGGAGALAPAFQVDLALGEDPEDRDRMRVFRRSGGRPASTAFRVVETFGRFAWIEARALSSRRHQVRVHLASAGAAVLNDALYGDPSVELRLSDLKRGYKGRENERPLVARLALHASSVEVADPETGEARRIVAPLPRDLEVALRQLRRFGGGAFRRPGARPAPRG